MNRLLTVQFEAAKTDLAANGVLLELTDSDDGREKVAARWDASSPRALAQLVLWNTGEAELLIADLESGEVVVNEHRQITSTVGLADAIETIREHLRPQGLGRGPA
jgi:hypothetical protein